MVLLRIKGCFGMSLVLATGATTDVVILMFAANVAVVVGLLDGRATLERDVEPSADLHGVVL